MGNRDGKLIQLPRSLISTMQKEWEEKKCNYSFIEGQKLLGIAIISKL